MSFKLNDPQFAIYNINKCISDIRTWMITNCLKINNSKTEFLIIRSLFSKVASLQDFTISVGGSSICCSQTARNLWVNFDSVMNLESHIDHVCKIAYMNLCNIRQIRNVLTDQSAAQLIHVLISSRIDYCNSILYGMSDSVISDLQHIQNTATRILAKCGHSFFHSKIILNKLHWLPIKQRIVYKILITTHKVYHSIAPKYICDFFTLREYKRELSTNDQMNLVVPLVKRKHFGERSFSYAAPREWNKLKLSIRKSEVWNLLRKKLKPIFLSCI